MEGYRIRTLPAPIFVDLFKTLGASPVALPASQMYTAAQTHLVDGTDLPLSAIDGYRIYEVQKFVSITHHMFGGYRLTANPEALNALPPDVRAVLDRNVVEEICGERIAHAYDRVGVVRSPIRFCRKGLIFNTAEVGRMRARLSPYYVAVEERVRRHGVGLAGSRRREVGLAVPAFTRAGGRCRLRVSSQAFVPNAFDHV